MRVLYTLTAYARGPGDIITPWLTETVERLHRRGVEVEILAPAWRGLPDHVLGVTRVHRFRYAPKGLETLTHEQTAPDRVREHPLFLGLVPGYVAAGTLAAARLARSGRFDVVHSFWPLPHGIFGLAARRAGGIPLVTTFFGVELRWLRASMPYLAPLMRAVIHRSAAVTAISTHTAAEVRRLVPDADVHLIPFGAATEPAGDPPAIRRTSSRPFRILFTGRLVERKGVDVLLRSLALLPDRDIRLAVVGDGPERGRLGMLATELGVADRVEFAGFVSAEELGRRFGECDVLVLPAVEDSKGDVEGLGVVLIESLLHARPVIASDSGGIPDIVQDGETGLLVPPGDAGALARAIARLMDDPALAARLTEAGRAHVVRRFAWDPIVDRLAGIYEAAVAKSRVARG